MTRDFIPRSLLIYAPVPIYRNGQHTYVERQAINGMRLWAQHFPHVTVMMPEAKGKPPQGWEPIDLTAQGLRRVTIEPLPMAYRPDQFAKVLPGAYGRIRRQIAKSAYLSFAIGGLFGDWGAVASIAAHRMGRAYAVWTDRVESEVTRHQQHHGSWRSRLRAHLYRRPMAGLERAVISRARLGLFHGAETFAAYSHLCKNAQLVHDIHLSKGDHISSGQLAAKVSTSDVGRLRLIYVGRADAMKGAADWVRTMQLLRSMGVDFRATWVGDGPELPKMQRQLEKLKLQKLVSLAGYADGKQDVLRQMRGAHAFVFCHKTPESPRCLIEALSSGCPLVGYDGAFARDLISPHVGGVLVQRDDVVGLAWSLAHLDQRRDYLARITHAAGRAGASFTAEKVFAHRSDLIKAHLPSYSCAQPVMVRWASLADHA